MIMEMSGENDGARTTAPSAMSDTSDKAFVNASITVLSSAGASTSPLHLAIDSTTAIAIMSSYSQRDLGRNATPLDPSSLPSETRLYVQSVGQTCLVIFFSMLILITIVGNTLVILSLITTRRLRTVTNCFVMSLAVADWTVGVFVMPPAVLLYIHGKRLIYFPLRPRLRVFILRTFTTIGKIN